MNPTTPTCPRPQCDKSITTEAPHTRNQPLSKNTNRPSGPESNTRPIGAAYQSPARRPMTPHPATRLTRPPQQHPARQAQRRNQADHVIHSQPRTSQTRTSSRRGRRSHSLSGRARRGHRLRVRDRARRRRAHTTQPSTILMGPGSGRSSSRGGSGGRVTGSGGSGALGGHRSSSLHGRLPHDTIRVDHHAPAPVNDVRLTGAPTARLPGADTVAGRQPSSGQGTHAPGPHPLPTSGSRRGRRSRSSGGGGRGSHNLTIVIPDTAIRTNRVRPAHTIALHGGIPPARPRPVLVLAQGQGAGRRGGGGNGRGGGSGRGGGGGLDRARRRRVHTHHHEHGGSGCGDTGSGLEAEGTHGGDPFIPFWCGARRAPRLTGTTVRAPDTTASTPTTHTRTVTRTIEHAYNTTTTHTHSTSTHEHTTTSDHERPRPRPRPPHTHDHHTHTHTHTTRAREHTHERAGNTRPHTNNRPLRVIGGRPRRGLQNPSYPPVIPCETTGGCQMVV